MYKCVECGHLFEDGEQKIYRENIGECHGSPSYMDFSVCPICGGEYEEIMPCSVCGTYEHDFGRPLCKDCEEEVKKEFLNFACNLNEDQKEFLVKLFEDGEIL